VLSPADDGSRGSRETSGRCEDGWIEGLARPWDVLENKPRAGLSQCVWLGGTDLAFLSEAEISTQLAPAGGLVCGHRRASSAQREGQEFPLSPAPVDGLFVTAVRGRRGGICSISRRRGPDHSAGGASIVNANA